MLLSTTRIWFCTGWGMALLMSMCHPKTGFFWDQDASQCRRDMGPLTEKAYEKRWILAQMMGTVPGLNQQPESCKYKDMIILFVAEECPGIQTISKLRICGHQLDAPIPSCSEPRSCFCKHSWTLASWESFSCNLRRSFSSSSWWASNSSLRFCLDTDPPQPMAKKQPGSPRHNHEIQKTWALQNVPRGFCLACDPNISKSGSIFRIFPFHPFESIPVSAARPFRRHWRLLRAAEPQDAHLNLQFASGLRQLRF